MDIVINVLRGLAVGLANIIPGVSGGTMALILGIYERLLKAISNLGPGTLKALFRGKQAILDELRRVDAVFLGSLGLGAGLAIVGTAKLMTYLLEHQHDPTYGFFFGLVLASVAVPLRLIRRRTAGAVVAFLVAAACVVALTLAMSGEERLASAQKKAEVKAAQVMTAAAGDAEKARDLSTRVSQDPMTMAIFFGGGAIAISAMILPGISGSFMLLLMGIYFDVLSCITGFQILMLSIFASGCLLGLLAFTRFLNWLLGRFYDVTMAFLAGLVLGSLYAIWPFKTFGLAGGKRVDMDPILPTAFGTNEILTLVAVLAGVGLVVAFMVVELRQERAKSSV